MRILTFIKPVKTEYLHSSAQKGEEFSINPYDAKALEEMHSFKNRDGVEMICASMGPEASACVLQRALAWGFESAYLLCDKAFAGADTVATTYALEKAVKKTGAHIVVAGEKSADGETGQTPFGLAERMGWGCVSGVESITAVDPGAGTITLKCKCIGENGSRIVLAKAPVVIIFRGLTVKQPALSLISLKRAKAKGVSIWSAEDIEADKTLCGLKGSHTRVINIKDSFEKKEGEKITAFPAEAASILLNIISNRHKGLLNTAVSRDSL